MTTAGTITKILANGLAEVSVSRGTACGGNCDNCEACISANSIQAVAKNSISAAVGDKVVLDCRSSVVYKAIALVYVVPIVLMLLGYAVGYLLGLSEGLCILLCFLGVIAGGVIIVVSQKKSRFRFEYDIVEKLE